MADNMLIESVHVAIVFADDTVGVMQFVTRTPRWQKMATDENVEAEINRSFFGEGKTPIKGWRFIDLAELPAHRRYRDAWVDLGKEEGGIVHDMPKARDIHRNLLREARALAFPSLDASYLRADEAGDTVEKMRIATLKGTLRDAPADPSIEAAQSVEELEAITLASLQ